MRGVDVACGPGSVRSSSVRSSSSRAAQCEEVCVFDQEGFPVTRNGGQGGARSEHCHFASVWASCLHKERVIVPVLYEPINSVYELRWSSAGGTIRGNMLLLY